MTGHVFISYSRADTEYVNQLVAFLEDQGLQPWIDRERISSGDRWARLIRDRVDACAAMVVVMSPDADASEWVKNEIDRARGRNRTILPLLLKGEKFFELGTIHYDDVRNGELPPDAFVKRLWQLTRTTARTQIKRPSEAGGSGSAPVRRTDEAATAATGSAPVVGGYGATHAGWQEEERRVLAPYGVPRLPAYRAFMPAIHSDRVTLRDVRARASALLVTAWLAAIAGAVLPPQAWWVFAAGGVAVLV